MPLFIRHFGASRRVHGRGPPFVAVIGYHSQEENASVFYKKSAALPAASRTPAASSPAAAGSSHRLPPVRTTSHTARPPRARAVRAPARRAQRSPATGPASAAMRQVQRPAPVQGPHRQQVEQAQGQVGPGGHPGVKPRQQQAAEEVHRRPRQHRRDLPGVGQPGGVGDQLRAEHADPQLRHPAPQQPQHQPGAPARGGGRRRGSPPAAASRSPGRTRPPAAKIRRRYAPPHTSET